MEQRSVDWRKATAGSVGGTAAYKVVAKTQGGAYTSKRKDLLADMFIERLIGERTEMPVSKEMQWGIDNEPLARNRYALENFCDVQEVGFIKHQTIKWAHYSPDGLIGDDGLLEIKCPKTMTHLKTLGTEEIAPEYYTQMQWGLAVTGRDWCDFFSYDNRVPVLKAQFYSKRVHRDDEYIARLETEIAKFLSELDEMVAKFVEQYGQLTEERAAA